MTAALRDRSLGPEWAVLELLAAGDDDGPALAELLGADDLSWGELLEQAVRHQMLAMLADAVATADLRGEIPLLTRLHLRDQLELNRWRTEVFRREAARVVRALDEQGVRFVATKGITLESTLYGGRGVRAMKDVDFMIAPSDRDAVRATLVEVGFEESYEWATDPRREQISIRLHPDHLPTHRRPTGQPVVPFVHVDFANSLTWSKSPFDVPVEEALGEIVRQPIPGVDDVELPCFVPTYQFLFTALHLFREAWLVKFSESATDVTLMKFVDVRRLAEHHRDALGGGRLASVAERHGVAAPLAWVLGHLDATFGTRTRADLGLDGRDDAATLAATLDASAYARWRGSMRERLASKDRRRLFEESRE